ncbi:hypothetical protein [Brevibacillus dissolubilis]|uniref:hypothetical protein n=1 Tax=Brevibacillus dissolubilis TaxID=1844116 RepID=UPI001115D447|nr:hypothetical protein [Brevibacillus dissolubilis]
MSENDKNQVPKINLFTTPQNMDTPYITESQADTDEINQALLEVDSDENEDPGREWLLDQSAAAFLDLSGLTSRAADNQGHE